MKNKNFIIIVIGQIISLFGNAIQRFSMSLYLLEFTGSTAIFANILAISTIPYILFAPIAGRLSDNINRKKIMVYLDLFCSILIGGYAFILLRGNDSALIVGTVMFMLSVCATLYGPAVTASIPQIVEEDKLTSANGVINQVGSIVNFVGPILAGILYGLLGIKVIVIVNAVSFFVSAIMEMFLDIPDVVKDNSVNENEIAVDRNSEKILSMDFVKKSFIDMKESFVYLKSEKKIVLGIIASYALCNIFLVPILSIVAPYFINVFLGLPSEVFGIVEAICVLGMILGGFWISVKPNMFSMKKVHYTYFPMIAGVIVMSTLGFIKLNNYALAGIFALGGLAIMLSLSLSNVLTLTFIQKQVPGEMLGRVSAFSTAVATISVAPGQLLFGQVIDMGIPIGIILLVSAIFNIGLMLFIKWNVRELK
ncbi:MFS transporter [uncultured Clostridium sp.]|uniref:MFS transporter n=1 Tax=uncultured Clostridium sp. TaxID=59620 RepID=UPI0025CE4B2F|nr:MFS transporter [uncultured Clostridium sp.]MDU4883774.1 MFS transporter [Clostridium celatum]MDU7077017.1 MFS transporter [Clostridium celatum]